MNLYGMIGNDPVNCLDLLGLKKCYKWMLITFYSGQKPKDGRNSWNQANFTENDAATGLAGYTYDSDKGRGVKTGPSQGRDDYAYPPGTQVTVARGTKGSDNRTVRDGGSGWVYPRPGAPNGVGQNEWLDLWTPSDTQARKKGTEVDLVAFDTRKNKCDDCPKGWSEDPKVPMPDNLKKIKEALGK